MLTNSFVKWTTFLWTTYDYITTTTVTEYNK